MKLSLIAESKQGTVSWLFLGPFHDKIHCHIFHQDPSGSPLYPSEKHVVLM